MTYSIVALDPATGDLGIAVQSKFLGVGAVVPWAKAGVGAIATQSFANVRYGVDGLALLSGGAHAQEALDRLVAPDALRSQRQVGIVDAAGRSATHTGDECFAWAGGQAGPGFAAQGNILAGAAVVDGLVDTLLAGGRAFPELLVACLAAADAAGGDRRGRESAALYIVREGGGYGGGGDRWVDLRVDDHEDPIGELGRLVELQRLYFDRPTAAELLPITEDLAAELRRLMSEIGADPGGRFSGVYQPMWQVRGLPGPASGLPAPGSANDDADAERPMTGTPRELPDGWTEGWHDALADWMGVVNLEERLAAPGWIDPRVLAELRKAAASA
jgi:uncharacterized Ntn-hydrolase superfamily protein